MPLVRTRNISRAHFICIDDAAPPPEAYPWYTKSHPTPRQRTEANMPTDNWQAALATAKRLALRFPGVTGVDYGYRYQAGVRSAQLCVRFHVSRKLPLHLLRAHELLPAELGAVACDVVQAQYAPRLSAWTPDDPVVKGAAARPCASTFGAVVREAGSGRLCVLNNWHVLGATGAALERWLDLGQGYDAAIALLPAEAGGSTRDIGIRIDGVEEPRLGLALQKLGAASGVTRALVDGIEGTFELDYGGYGDQKRRMDGCRLISDPSQASDQIGPTGNAGAVWINPATQRAVALHFAGDDGAAAARGCVVAHPISRILNLLDLTL